MSENKWPEMRPISELPESGRVLVAYTDNGLSVYEVCVLNAVENPRRIGWFPLPPPPVPPKPEQLTPDEALGILKNGYGGLAVNAVIDAIEKRTCEIVRWEQKYGGEE